MKLTCLILFLIVFCASCSLLKLPGTLYSDGSYRPVKERWALKGQSVFSVDSCGLKYNVIYYDTVSTDLGIKYFYYRFWSTGQCFFSHEVDSSDIFNKRFIESNREGYIGYFKCEDQTVQIEIFMRHNQGTYGITKFEIAENQSLVKNAYGFHRFRPKVIFHRDKYFPETYVVSKEFSFSDIPNW